MTPLLFTLSTFGISILAGIIGSLLGLGGGIIVVPALTLLFGIDIRLAVGASLVSVIATSSAAAAAYVREHMTNLRVAMWLEIGTTAGALSGAFLAGVIHPKWIYFVFAINLIVSAFVMFRKRRDNVSHVPDAFSRKLKLGGKFYDKSTHTTVEYEPTRAAEGLGLMYLAGILSGLLGIGSGSLKVPAMDLAMRLPIKVSTATSNLMMGVTAAASAGVYFARGEVLPFIAAPVATGVLIGATLGARILPHVKNNVIRSAFVVVLMLIAAQMLWKGTHQ